MWSCTNGKIDVIKALQRAGADMEIRRVVSVVVIPARLPACIEQDFVSWFK